VKVGPQVLVVGVGEGGFTKLGEIAATELPRVESSPGATFPDVLARVLAGKDGAPPASPERGRNLTDQGES
jgi:hypothetical protein